MGQAASRAADVARRAVAPRVPRTTPRTTPRTAQPPRPGRTIDEAASAWESARPHDEYSPGRGERHRSEASAAPGAPDAVPEMPPDLLKFLEDAGPLKRTVDKERTSTRVYGALASDEGAREEREQARQANRRVRRRMPIVSDLGEEGGDDVAGGEMDGTMVERSTNFSTTDRSGGVREMELGVTREDLFRMVKKVEDLEVGAREWKKALEDEYRGVVEGGAAKMDFDRLKDKTLFEDSLKYIGVPVLMEDEEGDIIGLWRHKVEKLKFGHGLKYVPERSLQFVLLNESDERGVAKGS